MCFGKGRYRVVGLTGRKGGDGDAPLPQTFRALLSLGILIAPEPSSIDSQRRLLDARPKWGHWLWGCLHWGGMGQERAEGLD